MNFETIYSDCFPFWNTLSDNDKDFDELLDDFIKSQLEEDEENTETTCWSVQEEPYEPYPDDDKTEENENETEDCSSDTDETNSEDDNYDDSDYDEEDEEDVDDEAKKVKYLSLYDSIITSGKNLFDGRILD